MNRLACLLLPLSLSRAEHQPTGQEKQSKFTDVQMPPLEHYASQTPIGWTYRVYPVVSHLGSQEESADHGFQHVLEELPPNKPVTDIYRASARVRHCPGPCEHRLAQDTEKPLEASSDAVKDRIWDSRTGQRSVRKVGRPGQGQQPGEGCGEGHPQWEFRT